jgi:hypothetical protein
MSVYEFIETERLEKAFTNESNNKSRTLQTSCGHFFKLYLSYVMRMITGFLDNWLPFNKQASSFLIQSVSAPLFACIVLSTVILKAETSVTSSFKVLNHIKIISNYFESLQLSGTMVDKLDCLVKYERWWAIPG